MRRKSSRVTWCPCEKECARSRGTGKPLQIAVDRVPPTGSGRSSRPRYSKLDPIAALLDMDQNHRPTAAKHGACICDPNRVFTIEVDCLPERNLVFVVDDDAMMLKSVARLLRQLGYESVLFPSAEAFANHSDFDGVICVLLDINLGDVSGIEVRRRLKEANNFVPVIYITGNDTPATREAAHQSGCFAYLTTS